MLFAVLTRRSQLALTKILFGFYPFRFRTTRREYVEMDMLIDR